MKTRDILMYSLGGIIVVAFFTTVYLLIKNPAPVENKDILLIVIGALVAKFGDVVGYFYGSSRGSADKTDIMANGKAKDNSKE